jgi:hypothetical protein
MSASPALPWGAGADPAPADPLRDAAANMALLGAARALVKAGMSSAPGDSAEQVVSQALGDMSADRRVAAATILRQTEERIYSVIKRLQEGSTREVTAEEVHQAFLEEIRSSSFN